MCLFFLFWPGSDLFFCSIVWLGSFHIIYILSSVRIWKCKRFHKLFRNVVKIPIICTLFYKKKRSQLSTFQFLSDKITGNCWWTKHIWWWYKFVFLSFLLSNSRWGWYSQMSLWSLLNQLERIIKTSSYSLIHSVIQLNL